MPRIDLNCDLGEGAGHDAELMPLVTSANIACGAHAGDEATMRETIALAKRHGVAIGAHPGFADRENFGREEITLSFPEVAGLVSVQVRQLQTIALSLGTVVSHVKLHGALYNMASRDRALAGAIVDAIRATGFNHILYALAGSELEKVARAAGCRVASEVFADRTYRADGSLTPRERPDALIADENAAVSQVLRLAREGRVRSVDGADVEIRADTVCLHGDGEHAVAFARRLRTELDREGIEVRTFS